MNGTEQHSESESGLPKGITDEASCLDYLKKKEVFLYKMMNDPSHKAMLYFLEVLMNAEQPITIEQLADRFSHKTFSPEMREACGGGSAEGLREFLLRYPSLFKVTAEGHVHSVAIELPEIDGLPDDLQDLDCWSFHSNNHSSISNDPLILKPKLPSLGKRNEVLSKTFSFKNRKIFKNKSASSLSLTSNASGSSISFPFSTSNNTSEKNNGQLIANTNGDRLTTGAHVHCSRNCAGQNQISNCCKPVASDVSTSPCVHCSFVELACHHHHHHQTACAIAHHCHHSASTTATATHCICPNTCLSCLPLCYQCHNISTQSKNTNNTVGSIASFPPLERLTLETEAVRFFQQRLLRKEEKWVQIKSLAGHLSQARAEIRAVVGPQLEFRNFLLRHPHVFEVQGELVSVRDPFGAIYPTRKEHGFYNSHSSTNLYAQGHPGSQRHIKLPRPKSLILPNGQGQLFGNLNGKSKPFRDPLDAISNSWTDEQLDTFKSATRTPTGIDYVPDISLQENKTNLTKMNQSSSAHENSLWERAGDLNSSARGMNSLSISMSANEYRSVMFVRKVLEKRGGASNQSGLSLIELLRILSENSPEAIRNTIGWTKVEVQEFIKQNHLFFDLFHEPAQTMPTSNNLDIVSTPLVKNKRLEKMVNIIITGASVSDMSVRSLTNHSGRIYHITKLWGIIDLGKHEHVFFDKSIFKNIDDLQKHFQVGELLYFNAILAPKESRAKWRATQVWKECDRQAMEKTSMPGQLSNAQRSDQSGFLNNSSDLQTTGNTRLDCTSSGKVKFIELGMDNEDTDAEGEIEEIDVASLSLCDDPNKLMIADASYENEFALNGDEILEEEEEPYLSSIARQEGLNLVNDVKFIQDEICADNVCAEILSNAQDKHFAHANCNSAEKIPKQSDFAEHIRNQQSVTSTTENAHSECDGLSPPYVCTCDTSCKPEMTKSFSSTDSCSMSIAVQTLCTGDIMASNVYHDQKEATIKMKGQQ